MSLLKGKEEKIYRKQILFYNRKTLKYFLNDNLIKTIIHKILVRFYFNFQRFLVC